ncbi:hypothetical protein AC578_4006 [Pseudocercospora eumusae]|uniref:Uncharacterized protein n=1 Tax=Pseudocercospora eumusae TaxID=321146 RepID=A0A139HLN9_9PEZI|nr:hypothetical protein AC578_4006 [Pseudocercospora eumusae]
MSTGQINAVPTSKNLLLACKLIHHEASAVYKESCRNFWLEHNFILDCSSISAHECARYLRSAREGDINLSGHQAYTLVDPRGGWRVVKTWGIGSNEPSFLRYRPWFTRKSSSEPSVVDPTRAAYDTCSDEKELKDACEKYNRRPPPLKTQILDLLGIDTTNV